MPHASVRAGGVKEKEKERPASEKTFIQIVAHPRFNLRHTRDEMRTKSPTPHLSADVYYDN
jgi:hypothetical protein